MNQTEIDELRRLASVSREPRHGIGCIASDCALASAARNALPRLLAALEEARAERDELQDESNAVARAFERYAPLTDSLETTAHSLVNAAHERDDADEVLAAAESLAWDALGRPEGTHDTTNVQRLCEAHGALKAKLADAEAERSEARSLLINGTQTNVDSLAFLEHVRREHAAVVSERDAIKATLAKHAESERAWCELATDRGAKLAALVAEVDDIVTNGIDDAEGAGGYSSEFALGCLCRALAAAKVQP